jgi:NAD(P)-dependent dehydrogenase (short-subunit alcohol dehydrogenase family)
MARPVLLIAGGSRGIGAATAKMAATRGYDVAVNYKSNTKAAEGVVAAVKAAGGRAVALQGDMAVKPMSSVYSTRQPKRSARLAISCTVLESLARIPNSKRRPRKRCAM